MFMRQSMNFYYSDYNLPDIIMKESARLLLSIIVRSMITMVRKGSRVQASVAAPYEYTEIAP